MSSPSSGRSASADATRGRRRPPERRHRTPAGRRGTPPRTASLSRRSRGSSMSPATDAATVQRFVLGGDPVAGELSSRFGRSGAPSWASTRSAERSPPGVANPAVRGRDRTRSRLATDHTTAGGRVERTRTAIVTRQIPSLREGDPRPLPIRLSPSSIRSSIGLACLNFSNPLSASTLPT